MQGRGPCRNDRGQDPRRDGPGRPDTKTLCIESRRVIGPAAEVTFGLEVADHRLDCGSASNIWGSHISIAYRASLIAL